MENFTTYCQALYDQLTAQIPQLAANVHEYVKASPHCSCNQRGHCSITLTTFSNDEDGTTSLEPQVSKCSCQPRWRQLHHQRQLDLITNHLQDLQTQTAQLAAFEKGVRQLLQRHRELAKGGLKKEQYWLRQDYAWTDQMKRWYNLDVRERNARRQRDIALNGKGKSAVGDDGVLPDWEKEIPVDGEDLYVDEDVYEFRLRVSGKPSSESQCTPEGTSGSQNDGPQTVLKITLHDIRKHDFLSLDEVLNRFEDFKARAAILRTQWQDEDDKLASKIHAVYPQLSIPSACACTTELELYHRYQDSGSRRVHSDLEAERLKSDGRMDSQRMITAQRGREIELLLRSLDEHVGRQVADLEAVFGKEGTGKALVAYLARYDPEIDLGVKVEDGGYPSEALTVELLGRADEILERWAVEDVLRGKDDVCGEFSGVLKEEEEDEEDG
ncbi:hypothetical protein XPA_002781 [Xanthoria parietina]